MKTVHKNPVLMFNPHQKAKRLQFSIPYKQKKDWQRIKEMPGSFYNRTQRMWSIPNTEKNLKKVQVFFGDRLQIQERSKQAKIPSIDRKSTRLNSSHVAISYAVFCLKKK